MRKLVVTTIVTLDGYVAGPGNDVYVMPMDHAFDESNLDLMRTSGTALFGATTYREFVGFWPHAAGNPEFAGRPSAEIAARWPDLQKVVVSDSLTPAETGPWSETTVIVPRAEAHAAVADLRKGDADQGDIVMWGSRTLWNDLLTAGLVDQLHLMVGPVALGGGTPAFGDGVTTAGLRLTGVRRWGGSDNVLLSYDA
jgi:dihydrofolate reductase